MKSSTIATLLAPASVRAIGGSFGAGFGVPDCAQSCVSSYYTSALSTQTSGVFSTAATAFCTSAAPIESCLSEACSATPTVLSSYSAATASLCSQWSTCSSAGSTTGVYTVPFPGVTGTADDGHGGIGGNRRSGTLTGGEVTATGGCDSWDGSPWFGGGLGGGFGLAPNGFSWIKTTTVTETVTQTDASGSVVTTLGLATVAEAVSGDVTSTSTLVGTTTSTGTGTAAAASSTVANSGTAARCGMDGGVKAMGTLLGGVVAFVGLL